MFRKIIKGFKGKEKRRIMQKKWVTPRLILLTRGTLEENVLQACKTANPGGPLVGVCKKGKNAPDNVWKVGNS